MAVNVDQCNVSCFPLACFSPSFISDDAYHPFRSYLVSSPKCSSPTSHRGHYYRHPRANHPSLPRHPTPAITAFSAPPRLHSFLQSPFDHHKDRGIDSPRGSSSSSLFSSDSPERSAFATANLVTSARKREREEGEKRKEASEREKDKEIKIKEFPTSQEVQLVRLN